MLLLMLQLVYTLAWTRQDGRPLPSRIVDDGMGTLTIRNAQPDDSGTYICTGSDFSYLLDTDFARLTVRGHVLVLFAHIASISVDCCCRCLHVSK